MNYINKVLPMTCKEGQPLDAIFLSNGYVIAIFAETIELYTTTAGFLDGTETPAIMTTKKADHYEENNTSVN
jgi:hypothetical protein